MRISTKGRHAVMAMVDIACNAGDKPVPLAEVAQRQMISLSYLEQLVAKLKKNGLVKSMRGPGGGYILGLDQKVMTIYQIVVAVDTVTQREKALSENANQVARKLTDHLWSKVSEEVYKYLKSVTLADVVQRKI
jgi:Rrf2 family transcriptional regulator, iron-sulfur cluster assembly transcription factor